MHRLGLSCLIVVAACLAQGCCCGPCGIGGGQECGPLAANPVPPACGGCGECIHCRRWGALQAARNLILCHNGCGDLYYDEWYSDPAAPHDPCDYCYCPGPFRRAWWHLVALHTAPHPGCYAPSCGERCYDEGGACADADFADDDWVDDGGYDVSDMGGPIYEQAPSYTAPQPRPARPVLPTETIDKAQRDWNPRVKTGGFQIVPRGAFASGPRR